MNTLIEIIKNPVVSLVIVLAVVCLVVWSGLCVFEWLKNCFTPSFPANAFEPPRGVVAKAENDTTVITLRHIGGDMYEITETSKITKKGFGSFRKGENRAKSHFEMFAHLNNIKL